MFNLDDRDEIDTESLKEDLVDYFGTAMFSGNPMAMMELEEVRSAGPEKVLKIARKNNVNLDKYKK